MEVLLTPNLHKLSHLMNWFMVLEVHDAVRLAKGSEGKTFLNGFSVHSLSGAMVVAYLSE